MSAINGLIVLVPYAAGQDFYSYCEDLYLSEDLDSERGDSEVDSTAYLPVYVATQDKKLALMAVAYEACICYRYVACPSTMETAQDWETYGYSGTLEFPNIELPETEEAYEIPDPGDCFCCGSLEDYEVLTQEEMAMRFCSSPDEFILQVMVQLDDEYKKLQQQLNKWIEKYLGSYLNLEQTKSTIDQDNCLSLSETIISLREPISNALRQGYNYKEIVELLSQHGIKISTSKLRKYLK